MLRTQVPLKNKKILGRTKIKVQLQLIWFDFLAIRVGWKDHTNFHSSGEQHRLEELCVFWMWTKVLEYKKLESIAKLKKNSPGNRLGIP